MLDHSAALDTLSAAATIVSGTATIFKAGKLVQLEDGFYASLGSSFLAQIDGCLPPSPLQRVWPKEAKTCIERAFLKMAPNPFVEVTTVDLIANNFFEFI